MEKPVRSSFQYLSISYECSLAIGNSLNLPEMLQEVIHTVVHKTNAHRGIIWVKNREQEFQPVANAGINIEDVLAQGEIKDLRDVLNQIQKRQQFVLRYKDDKDFLQYCPALTGKEECVLIVPVTNVAILYLVYASREIADEPLANLLASLSKKLSVAIEACTAHENVIKEIQVREKAENELTKKTEQLVSSQKELQGLYGESEQARKSLLSILEDVAQKEEALRESEKKYRLLTENALDTVWAMNLDGTFTFMSQSIKKLRGYTPEEANRLSMQETMTPKSVLFIEQIFEDENSKPMAERWADRIIELEQYRKDGSTIWTDVSIQGVRDEKGNVIGLQGSTRDITERKQAEVELQKLNDELEQRVIERTSELEEMNKDLESMVKAFTGREIRMIELKDIIKDLEKQLATRENKGE